MVTKKMTINIPSGLAARPAAILVQVAVFHFWWPHQKYSMAKNKCPVKRFG